MRGVVAGVWTMLATMACLVGLGWLATEQSTYGHETADTVRVLPVGATSFVSAPTGLASDSPITLSVDGDGLTVEGTAATGGPVALGWNGSALVSTDPPHEASHLFEEDPLETRLPGGGRIILAGDLTFERADRTHIPIALPDGARAYHALIAGPYRVLLVGGGDQERTYFFDTRSLAIAPGPVLPHFSRLVSGTDHEGNLFVFLVDSDTVVLWNRLLPPVGLVGLGALALLAVVVAFFWLERSKAVAAGAFVGCLGAFVLVAAGGALFVWALSGMNFL